MPYIISFSPVFPGKLEAEVLLSMSIFKCSQSCVKLPILSKTVHVVRGTIPIFQRSCSLRNCTYTHTKSCKPQGLQMSRTISTKTHFWPPGEGEPGVSSSTEVPANYSCFLPSWPPDSASSTFEKASGCPGFVPYGVKAYSAFKAGCNSHLLLYPFTATQAV